MDARKRQINILEEGKQKSQNALDFALEGFGEELFRRIEAAGLAAQVTAEPPQARGESDRAADVAEYFRLQKEITDCNAAIAAVEEQALHLKELEGQIEEAERENKELEKDLSGAFRKLGKALLDDNSGAYAEIVAPFREQADSLTEKIKSLERRCSEVDQKNGSNVFSWIGKNAQGLVLRSFLSKTQESLDRLYRNAGEDYSRKEGFEENNASADVAANAWETAGVLDKIKVLSEEKERLKGEKRKITSVFDAEGSPIKQIQALRNRILQEKERLRVIYSNIGTQAALADYETDITEHRKEFVASFVTAEDKEKIENAVALKRSILDAEEAVKKLRAALAIDDEKAKIEKCRKTIEEKKLRIAEAENAIGELETEIKDSQGYIEELQKLL